MQKPNKNIKNERGEKMKKRYENDIDYKGYNIVIWNDNGKRVFAIGNKEFAHMPFAKEYVDNIHKMEDAFIDGEGVYRWSSSGNVPFDDMLECWGLSDKDMEICRAARDIDDSNFLREYRKRMENYEPSDEEMYEMKAAFGEGEVVVNVISGKKIQL